MHLQFIRFGVDCRLTEVKKIHFLPLMCLQSSGEANLSNGLWYKLETFMHKLLWGTREGKPSSAWELREGLEEAGYLNQVLM